MERNAKHHVMGMLKGGGMHQLLCLWARGLLLCQLERRERRNSSGRKRWKKGGNNGGGGGRRTRKSISNSIGETRSMLNSDGELTSTQTGKLAGAVGGQIWEERGGERRPPMVYGQ